MVIMKGEKNATDNLYEHKLPNSTNAQGILHAYQDQSGKWCFMSEAEYNLNKESLPPVCIAFKCPIPNMEAVLNRPLFSVDLQSLV